MATLNDLFPGRRGKIELARVILKLCRPELASMNMDEPVSAMLAEEIRQALRVIRKDH